MRYAAVYFDYGDTLAPIDKHNVPQFHEWSSNLIKKLYGASYRLAVISNTHRYQDAYWIRNELNRRGILQHFELIVSSALYAKHKPNLDIFRKALDFMQLDPVKVLMVGDSEHCDGACQFLGMSYMKVAPDEKWGDRLLTVLDDPMPSSRKLSVITEYGLLGNKLVVKLRHLSEGIEVGDTVVVGQKEAKVLSVSRAFTKEDVLRAKDEFVEMTIQ
jgi:FMN phosphatase YigB (HAD superfamily)